MVQQTATSTTDMKKFRIYGKDGDKIWKLIWATQGPQKDIQFSAHITNGENHISIHSSGRIHLTSNFPNGKTYPKIQKPWKLDSFKYFDYINNGALAKEAIHSLPVQRVTRAKVCFLNLSKYPLGINYWVFLVEHKYLNEVTSQILKLFPGLDMFHTTGFEPELLVCTFDPSVHHYGNKYVIKAKENSTEIMMPKTFSINLSIKPASFFSQIHPNAA